MSEESLNENLVKLRRNIHQNPELSGLERNTAALLQNQLKNLNPDELITDVGGHGIAAKFNGPLDGPSILFRAELDALPIQEDNGFYYRSINNGVSHKCGHDGHMAIIYGLAEAVAKQRPERGSVILLFQPAEETGEGARAVVADAKFEKLNPDYCYALHNLPGYSMGEVLLRVGTFNCASRGMIIKLRGKTAHAAYPETGDSPAMALAELLQSFETMPRTINRDELLMATTVSATMGEEAFGTAPGNATFMVTLRSETNEGMEILVEESKALAEQIAHKNSLNYEIEWSDIFDASVNNKECALQVEQSARATNHKVTWLDDPFRWSEDFGAISACAKGAMFAFGAGEDNPQIHNPDYDFPDELIEKGISIFFDIYKRNLL